MHDATKTSQEWIGACQGLVRSLAIQIQQNLPRHLELDDLISYGQIGLAEAARDFDPLRGGKFSTFAYYRIRGAIYDGLSKMSWVSRAHYNRIKYQQMSDDVLRLESEVDGEGPGGLEDNLRWLKNVAGSLAVVYLSSQAGESEDLEVEDRAYPSPPAVAIAEETHSAIHQLIDQLPPEAQTLIRATYFEGLTLTEAGRRVGIGKAWASRLHARTLKRLARALRRAGVHD
jgi:RNA polymerase sigma factor FliA